MAILITLAQASDAALRRTAAVAPRTKAFRLLTARVLGPSMTALERFLEARGQAFKERSWV